MTRRRPTPALDVIRGVAVWCWPIRTRRVRRWALEVPANPVQIAIKFDVRTAFPDVDLLCGPHVAFRCHIVSRGELESVLVTGAAVPIAFLTALMSFDSLAGFCTTRTGNEKSVL